MVREYFESVLQENGGQIAEYAAKIEEQQLELESVEKDREDPVQKRI